LLPGFKQRWRTTADSWFTKFRRRWLRQRNRWNPRWRLRSNIFAVQKKAIKKSKTGKTKGTSWRDVQYIEILHNNGWLLHSWRTCRKQDYKTETHSSNNDRASRQQYLVSLGCYDSPTATFPTSSMHHNETSSSETVSIEWSWRPHPLLTYDTTRSASALHETSTVSESLRTFLSLPM
jgi:hypothetical protein